MTVVHEESYKGFGLAKIVHRNRLMKIKSLFEAFNILQNGVLADFGCSNGYILSIIQSQIINNASWKFYGFDHSEELLSQAKKKNLRNTEFVHFDLNTINKDYSDNFDIITCFETLEHTGNYRNALTNLYIACKIGGIILISIPNEKGLQGLLKYFARKIIRKKPYGDFFVTNSELKYIWHLITNKPIEVFRDAKATGWGPHLGFDYKLFENYLYENMIKTEKCRILSQKNSFLNFNRLYVIEKIK